MILISNLFGVDLIREQMTQLRQYEVKINTR